MANSVFLLVANSFSWESIDSNIPIHFLHSSTDGQFDALTGIRELSGSVRARGTLGDTFSDWVHTGNMTISIYKYILSWCLCSVHSGTEKFT
jgi:hypothetical protein